MLIPAHDAYVTAIQKKYESCSVQEQLEYIEKSINQAIEKGETSVIVDIDFNHGYLEEVSKTIDSLGYHMFEVMEQKEVDKSGMYYGYEGCKYITVPVKGKSEISWESGLDDNTLANIVCGTSIFNNAVDQCITDCDYIVHDFR